MSNEEMLHQENQALREKLGAKTSPETLIGTANTSFDENELSALKNLKCWITSEKSKAGIKILAECRALSLTLKSLGNEQGADCLDRIAAITRETLLSGVTIEHRN